MATITGTVRHNDLEGGFFELEADDGTTYRLEGGPSLQAGERVSVEGDVQAPGFGIHMVGSPVLKVRKVQPAG